MIRDITTTPGDWTGYRQDLVLRVLHDFRLSPFNPEGAAMMAVSPIATAVNVSIPELTALCDPLVAKGLVETVDGRAYRITDTGVKLVLSSHLNGCDPLDEEQGCMPGCPLEPVAEAEAPPATDLTFERGQLDAMDAYLRMADHVYVDCEECVGKSAFYVCHRCGTSGSHEATTPEELLRAVLRHRAQVAAAPAPKPKRRGDSLRKLVAAVGRFQSTRGNAGSVDAMVAMFEAYDRVVKEEGL